MNKYEQKIEAEIDLHGLTIKQAMESVKSFVEEKTKEKINYIRIVTGKGLHSKTGNTTIKNAVIGWLSRNSYKYRYAKLNEGGEGAVLVSL